jgi:SAM-dependent methyltransferase
MSRNSKAKRDKKVRNHKKSKTNFSADKTPSFPLISERELYSVQWANSNAPHFEANGYYKWMADFISGCDKVLEIGTGGGHGTLELAKRGHKIISIDENPIILDTAEKYIRDNGIACTRIKRESILIGTDSYKINYRPISKTDIHDQPQVLLLEGDILNDPHLFEWLKNEALFDAVICWLTGTHGARIFNNAIIKRRIPTPGEYRLHVQNTVYELADEILRPGGKLHIVDRTQEPDRDDIKTEFFNTHKDQASVTSLIVDTLEYVVYEEPNDENKLEMCVTVPLSGIIPTHNKRAFTSIISHKP